MVDILTFNLDLYHFSYQGRGISAVAGVIYGFADPASATTTLTSSSANQGIYIGGYFHCWSLFDQIGLAQKEIRCFLFICHLKQIYLESVFNDLHNHRNIITYTLSTFS